MSWKDKAAAARRRFGASAPFAARLVVAALEPGASAVADLIGWALESVGDVGANPEANDRWLPYVTAEDLKRLEGVIDVLGGDLAGLKAQVAALEGLPDAAIRIVDAALQADGRCRAAARKLDALVRAFDAFGAQAGESLGQGYAGNRQDEVLPLMRGTIGVWDIADELAAGALTADEFRSSLAEFREGMSAMMSGRPGEAHARLEKLARSRPTSAAAAVAFAAAQAANNDFSGRKKSVARAARLRPRDAGLAELTQHLARTAPAAAGPAPTMGRAPARPPVQPQRPAGTLTTNALGMKFAWIPPGEFRMGSPPDEPQRRDDEIQHGVTIARGFWLGIYTVTQAQWAAVMHENPSRFEGDDLPVEQIAWRDVAAFCRALGRTDGRTYRLPTEAEWEYACRAGTTTTFHFGDAISTDLANYDGTHSYPGGRRGKARKQTTSGGRFPSNRWALFDMHGNVREWCQDWYGGSFPPEDVADPQGGESGGFRVQRGGSWRDHPAECRSAARHPRGPSVRDDNVGCRVVMVPD